MDVCLPADGKTTKELVTEGLALGDGGETTVLNLLSVELEGVLGELEALLHEGRKLTDAAALLTEDLLGVGSTDDDLQTKLTRESGGISRPDILRCGRA